MGRGGVSRPPGMSPLSNPPGDGAVCSHDIGIGYIGGAVTLCLENADRFLPQVTLGGGGVLLSEDMEGIGRDKLALSRYVPTALGLSRKSP